MIMLKVTKNQGLTLSVEDTFSEKPHELVKLLGPPPPPSSPLLTLTRLGFFNFPGLGYSLLGPLKLKW